MKKKLFTIFEILVWAVLFLIPTFFISTILNPDLDIKKHYYADFRDVNGIIIGSPVNYIGYNIGHVDNVQILEDRVRVDMAIVEKDYSLPKCSTIKVEESGIGGSRSLEIFPCEDLSLQGSIYTKKPKRVSEMLEDYCVFTDSLTQAMGNFLNILQINLDGGKCCKFQDLKKESETAQIELKQTSANLDKIAAKAPQNLKKTKNNLEKTLSSVKKIKINPEKTKRSAIKNQKDLEELNKKLNQYSAAEYREKTERLYWKTEVINVPDKDKLHSNMIQINNALQSSQNILRKIENSLQSESISNTREKVKNIKEETGDLIKKE